MSEHIDEPIGTPISDKVQAVLDAAREHIDHRLAYSDTDETLHKLAAALDALDEPS